MTEIELLTNIYDRITGHEFDHNLAVDGVELKDLTLSKEEGNILVELVGGELFEVQVQRIPGSR